MSTPLLHPLRVLTPRVWLVLYTGASVGLTHDAYHLHTCGPPIRGKPSRGPGPLEASKWSIEGKDSCEHSVPIPVGLPALSSYVPYCGACCSATKHYVLYVLPHEV